MRCYFLFKKKSKTYLLVNRNHSNVDQVIVVCYVNCIPHSLLFASKFCTSLRYKSEIFAQCKH